MTKQDITNKQSFIKSAARKKNEPDPGILKTLYAELNEDPYHKYNIAFALMSVLPFLTFMYILIAKFFLFDKLIGNVALILYISIFIAIMGYSAGYAAIRKILKKIIYYAAKIKRSDRMKSMLVTSISHEIKNPLYTLKLCLFDITDDLKNNMTDQHKEMLDTCNKTIDRIDNMVKDLLDIYKIKESIIDFKTEMCDLGSLIQEQLKEFSIMLNQKQIKLASSMPPKVIYAWVDKEKINQVFSNLISNAVKYTPENGSFKITLRSSGKFARVEVSDTGPGIPRETIRRLSANSESFDHNQHGSGFGLTIAKQIVELHNGRMIITAQSGKGSNITVLLPLNTKKTHLDTAE